MREIKFRAWDKENKCWATIDLDNWASSVGLGAVIVSKSSNPNKKYDEFRLESYEPFIWMQFTGLKDKNGKEIYEGDFVILDHSYGSKKHPVVVEWENLRAGWNVVSKKHIEVIGNIYENHELLK